MNITIPEHLAKNLDEYDIAIQTEEDIDDFMWNVYETYVSEEYATYDEIKAYINPLTRQFVEIEAGEPNE
jgi:hypothetical protein